jgi:hypothetical protein
MPGRTSDEFLATTGACLSGVAVAVGVTLAAHGKVIGGDASVGVVVDLSDPKISLFTDTAAGESAVGTTSSIAPRGASPRPGGRFASALVQRTQKIDRHAGLTRPAAVGKLTRPGSDRHAVLGLQP